MRADVKFDMKGFEGKEIMGILGGFYIIILILDTYKLCKSWGLESSPILLRQKVFFLTIAMIALSMI